MADRIASELLVERLIDWGVDTVFGLPGDGINGIMEGLRRHRDRLFDDVAAFNAMVHVPPQIPALVDRAVRTSLAHRTVSHITFPNDLQVADAEAHPWRTVAPVRTPRTAPVYLGPSGLPHPAACERAAAVLNDGQRVVMLVGVGALGARHEVLETAELLGSPIVKTQDMAALEDPRREPVQPQYLTRVLDRLAGDGGFAMLMAELDTAVRYGLPVKVIVVNNASLGQILWEQMVLGFPEHGVRFQRAMRFAPYAASCGALGIEVKHAGEVEPALRRALGHDGPALVDVMVNPDEPPMPGKVTYEQAKGFAQAWLRGQPRKATIASTLFRDKIEQLER